MTHLYKTTYYFGRNPSNYTVATHYACSINSMADSCVPYLTHFTQGPRKMRRKGFFFHKWLKWAFWFRFFTATPKLFKVHLIIRPYVLKFFLNKVLYFSNEGWLAKILAESGGEFFIRSKIKLISSRGIKMFLQKSALRKFSPILKVHIEIVVLFSYKLLLRSLTNGKNY